MLSSDGRLVLTFNGEVYNHRDLRAEVDAAGGTPQGGWRGHSDTETFLEAICAFGLEGALERAVGMFAFALWDIRERKLSLVRDRFGEKPLYYGWAGRDFLFGSELKALREHPRFEGAIDRDALSLYAARTYIPAPLSIYRRIFKLEPGCILTVGPQPPAGLDRPPRIGGSTGALALKRYWSYRSVLEAGLRTPILDRREALEELEKTLSRAVSIQSLADVPVGAFLSGGIDSSTIVGLYQKYSAQPVRTFTIGFDEASFNEAPYARAVARHFGTEHHERTVTPREAQDVIPRLPGIYDEPFADSSQIPTYLVSRFAREQVTVALSGDAGDELFGGYNRYFGTGRLWSKLKLLPASVRGAAGAALARVPAAVWDRAGRAVARDGLPPYFGAKVQKSLRTTARARNLEDVFTSFLDEWSGERSPVLGASGDANICPFDLDLGDGAPDALRMMYCDSISYLPDDILCKVDRASMAVGLEAHVPFLDHRVVELAARIPVGMKVAGGSGKHILRELLYREAPRELFDRPKAGFGIPVGEWIKGPLRDWAEGLLDPRQMLAEGWFDPEPIMARWQDHLSGRRDSTPALWSVLMFQSWLRQQKSASAAAA